MSDYLIDTNVFVRIFKGDTQIRSFIERRDAVIDATIYIECLQGSKSNAEKLVIKHYLDNFPRLMISYDVSERAISLIDSYSNSFGLLLPDVLIASTALENDLTIITYNTSDFKFIQGLEYLQPFV